MKTRIFTLLAICLPVVCLTVGCSKETLPEGLEWSVLRNPGRLPLMNGTTALAWELAVKNSSAGTCSFESVAVKDGSDVLLNLSGGSLDSLLAVYPSGLRSVNTGETALLFMWVEFPAGVYPPESLTQEVRFTLAGDSKIYTRTQEISINEREPVVLAAPVMARRYAAAGAPSNDSYHRRSVNYLDGKFWTADCYAVDLIGLNDGERFRIGRQNVNADYYGYNDIVFSATAGEVVSITDTIAENVPPLAPGIDAAAPYRACGNHVVVKVSAGVFVLYGHLVRGSIDLKAGDKVEAGQPIGRLGNSGNSGGPQLHLQVMDGPDPLRSHAIPWVFGRFTLHGAVTGYDAANGLVRVKYLNIQQQVDSKNIGGDAVVSFE